MTAKHVKAAVERREGVGKGVKRHRHRSDQDGPRGYRIVHSFL